MLRHCEQCSFLRAGQSYCISAGEKPSTLHLVVGFRNADLQYLGKMRHINSCLGSTP